MQDTGAMVLLEHEHHLYIYKLYLRNLTYLWIGYAKKLKKKYNIFISESFITKWFYVIGPCKGSMRLTSTFPSNKDSTHVFDLVQEYLKFIGALKDHKR